ncbi:MAG TPA: DUF357 domain-containing protein [archaeon]|nr:DUF357 domain-containing protein [archaeon]
MLETQLREETEKWIAKAKARRKSVKHGSKHLKNIDAYISDSEYFLSKNDLIHSFEAIIWAWSWIEILEELKQL